MQTVWRWLRQEDGYTFGLYQTFVLVTAGFALLLLLLWLGMAGVGYQDLRSAAQSVALAAQSEPVLTAGQSVDGLSMPSFSQPVWQVSSQAPSQAQAVWTQVSASLSPLFANLQMRVSDISGQEFVTVTGDFLPVFAQDLGHFPITLPASLDISMTATAQVQGP